jgi:hypothetical protein
VDDLGAQQTEHVPDDRAAQLAVKSATRRPSNARPLLVTPVAGSQSGSTPLASAGTGPGSG